MRKIIASQLNHQLGEYSDEIMGGGLPLFRGGHARLPLKLLSARAIDDGVVLLRYARDRA